MFITDAKKAIIIDGRAQAAQLKQEIKESAQDFLSKNHHKPGLAVILVGDNPASQVYVSSKSRACKAVGIESFIHILPADASASELFDLIDQFNKDSLVHGILLQMPLPPHLDPLKFIEAIDPYKDVDGLHPINLGRLMMGQPNLIPCTPFGSMLLIQSYVKNLEGLRAVVVGRSILVGKPMGLLLAMENATVTMAHSKTRDLAKICREADILVSAVGRPGLITVDHVKPGAIVIDVGITRATEVKLVGDVDFDAVASIAGYITPVPGGVGPMTIACLLKNTLIAAYQLRV